ncbi:hypothetical protein [Metabacillus iocasae]|uniref:Uncharacterized protein n=1 Tax=Priestia iocasae TaxID=2291674 RepID=A0ABS2QRA8_9BACI|nr:hypothetical protein [Metabacillus iocasae]MBM7701979.1 hypothetical protein [Metabacillus iocasae]
MFTYVTLLGFLAFLVYASTFSYSVFKRDGKVKKNGIRVFVSFLIMIIGFIGLALQ